MDILPVVPDLARELDVSVGDPSWLTDKALVRWQATNPRGFAAWFRAISAAEHRDRKVAAAKRTEVQVDDLPDDRFKTSLQLTVQLLKRHRDYQFHDDPDRLAPPSAVITALASSAYQTQAPYGGDLADVVEAVVADMPSHLHRTSIGKLWIPNPTCPMENYADRYDGRPEKEKALKDWLQRAWDDSSGVLTGQWLGEGEHPPPGPLNPHARRRHHREDTSKLTRLTTALQLAYRPPIDLDELLYNARLTPNRTAT